MKEEPRHRSPSKKKMKRLSWRLQKRKLQYQLLSNFGKHLASPDDIYEHHEQSFLGLQQKLLDIRKSLEHYRTTALPLYCASCASLGADVWCVVSVDAVGKGADAEKFRHAMCAINDTKEVKNHFFNADAVLAGALRFLDIHINAMKSAKSQIDHRKRVKLEFDFYECKVSLLKERQQKKIIPCTAIGSSSQKLERNEVKLQRAREMLQAVTVDLYRVFAKYESERDSMLNGELEMVRQVMHSFYAKNAEVTDFTITEEVDRAAVDVRTEQIFKRMVAKELEKDQHHKTHITKSNAPSTSLDPAATPGGADTATSSPPVSPTSAISVALSGSDSTTPPTQAIDGISAPSIQIESNLNAPTSGVEDDDPLAEKLKTIQLSRPVVPQLKQFRLRPSYNTSSNSDKAG